MSLQALALATAINQSVQSKPLNIIFHTSLVQEISSLKLLVSTLFTLDYPKRMVDTELRWTLEVFMPSRRVKQLSNI